MPADEYTELILRFQAPTEGHYPVETWVDGVGLCVGRPVALSSQDLDDCESPHEYGVTLWSKLVAGLPELSSLLAPVAGDPLRVRLRVLLNAEPWALDLHRIKWELLSPLGNLPAGVSAASPLSRFIPLRSAPDTTEHEFGLKILLAIASPTDLKDPLKPIDVEGEAASLLNSLDTEVRAKQVHLTVMPGIHGLSGQLKTKLTELGCTVLETPTTAAAITANLADKHVLHLIAHGNYLDNQAILVLENDQGSQAPLTPQRDSFVDRWASQGLRLVFLQSCLSDPADRALVQGGMATQFLQAGVPAVVAMRDLVAMNAARTFAAAFYQQLLLAGDVDVAVNLGRSSIFQAKAGDWAIPVVYSRLRASQKLWKPEPLRRSIQQLAADFANLRAVVAPFPVEVSVIRDIKAVKKQLDDPTSDCRVDAFETALKELKSDAKSNKIVVLLGGQGRAKSSLLQCLFVKLARDADPSGRGPQPLLVELKNCRSGPNAASVIEAGWLAMLRREGISPGDAPMREALQSNPLHLLVDGDEDVGPVELRKGLRDISQFLNLAGNRYALISMDQAAFKPEYFDEKATTVLIVQDLRPQTLYKFLYDREDIGKEEKALLTTSLRDLAGVPWILSRILRMNRDDMKSRFTVLERILGDQLEDISLAPGCGSLARKLMQSMAWQLHSRAAHNLHLPDTYALINTVRGTRDFSLDLFRKSLIDTRLVVESGPEGVRFGYLGAHAYFTACYLSGLDVSDRTERLREIVAGLGRPERMRRWKEVLLLLAGSMDDPSELLSMLLELGFGEGEHLLLASRCLNEARAAGNKVEPCIASQLADSLIWWSHPQSGIPARSRQRAVDGLGFMLSDCEEGELSDTESHIVCHLLDLVLKPLRTAAESSATKRRLDYSGVRLAAMTLLFRNQKLATKYWDKHQENADFRQDINKLLEAWEEGYPEVIKGFLNGPEDKAMLAGIAAFAFASWTSEWAVHLKERFFTFPVYEDVHWSIADSLIEMQSSVAMELIKDALDRMKRASASPTDVTPPGEAGPIPDSRVEAELCGYLVYIIGKLGGAMALNSSSPEIEFLRLQLRSESVLTQGRALRALAEIKGTTINGSENIILKTCHMLLDEQYDKAQVAMGVDPPRRLKKFEQQQLVRYALDALTHVGTEDSIAVLRAYYRRPRAGALNPYDETLRRSSWDMADKIRLRSRNLLQESDNE